MSATPSSGYAFSSWTTSSSSIVITCSTCVSTTITVNGAGTFTANFVVVPTYQVTFAASPSNAGTTSPTGTTSYYAGSEPIIIASAYSGYTFSTWVATGSITTACAGCTVTTATINGPGTVTAEFYGSDSLSFLESGLPGGTQWCVTVGTQQCIAAPTITFLEGPGTFSYTVAPASCRSGCQYLPTPSSGSVTVSGQFTNVPLSFTQQYLLTVSLTGTSSCGANRYVTPSNGWYNAGSAMSLTAYGPPYVCPGLFQSFSSWSGTYSGSSNPLTFAMTGPVTETARYTTVATKYPCPDSTAPVQPGYALLSGFALIGACLWLDPRVSAGAARACPDSRLVSPSERSLDKPSGS